MGQGVWVVIQMDPTATGRAPKMFMFKKSAHPEIEELLPKEQAEESQQ
jgi:hypothetical protein